MSNEDDEPWTFDLLVDKIEEWYRSLDEGLTTSLRRREVKTGEKISCFTCTNVAPGCCHQKVMVNLYEVFPIVRHIMRSGQDTPELRAKLGELAVAMEAGEREQWFREVHPCVFLEKDRCSIYPVRPVACRTYYVVSEPKLCQAESGTQEVGIIDCEEAIWLSMDKAEKIHKALNLDGPHLLMAALPRMVLLGLELMTHEDYVGFIKSQIWPTAETIEGWVDGRNPFRQQLYQIRRSNESPRG